MRNRENERTERFFPRVVSFSRDTETNTGTHSTHSRTTQTHTHTDGSKLSRSRPETGDIHPIPLYPVTLVKVPLHPFSTSNRSLFFVFITKQILSCTPETHTTFENGSECLLLLLGSGRTDSSREREEWLENNPPGLNGEGFESERKKRYNMAEESGNGKRLFIFVFLWNNVVR